MEVFQEPGSATQRTFSKNTSGPLRTRGASRVPALSQDGGRGAAAPRRTRAPPSHHPPPALRAATPPTRQLQRSARPQPHPFSAAPSCPGSRARKWMWPLGKEAEGEGEVLPGKRAPGWCL